MRKRENTSGYKSGRVNFFQRAHVLSSPPTQANVTEESMCRGNASARATSRWSCFDRLRPPAPHAVDGLDAVQRFQLTALLVGVNPPRACLHPVCSSLRIGHRRCSRIRCSNRSAADGTAGLLRRRRRHGACCARARPVRRGAVTASSLPCLPGRLNVTTVNRSGGLMADRPACCTGR